MCIQEREHAVRIAEHNIISCFVQFQMDNLFHLIQATDISTMCVNK